MSVRKENKEVMFKLRVLAIGLVALFALSAVTAAPAAKTKKVKTKVSATYNPGSSTDPYDEARNAFFKGKVKSRKKACRKKRTVVLKAGSAKVGKAKSRKKGGWKISAPGRSTGTYVVKVKKKKKGRTVCKPVKRTVVVP